MKALLSIVFVALSIVTIATALLRRSEEPDVPVLFWITDPNPAREKQLEVFHQWLEDNDYPRFEVRVDTANADISKLLIQGISGVAGDILDVTTQKTLPYFAEIGLLRELEEPAQRMGFTTAATYPALSTALEYNDRQYGFPCNVNTWMLVGNRDLFEELDLPIPPPAWTLNEFEAAGKAFVKKANADREGPRIFFTNPLRTEILRRGFGLDLYNETLTRCIADDPRNAEMLECLHQWTYEDRIMPSPTDLASASSDSGEGRLEFQLFQQERYAMLFTGRHVVITMREAGLDFDLSLSASPYKIFNHTMISARAAAIYQGSQHPDLAAYFLKFLTSPEYSELISEDGDGLPPSPELARSEAFLFPADYPNEHDLHEGFVEAADTIGIPASISPFISPFLANRIELNHTNAFTADLYDAKEASRRIAQDINEEIQRTLEANEHMRARYEDLLHIQSRINEYKEAGNQIPADWVSNPFYRKMYAEQGMLLEDGQ